MEYCIVGASYIREDEKPYIILSLRGPNGKRIKKRIPYLPYFFVSENDIKSLKGFVPCLFRDQLVDVQYGFRSVDGNRLVKIIVKDPKNVGDVNKQIKKADNIVTLYESNILFPYRYMIDNKLVTGVDSITLKPVEVKSRHKFIFIDIEVLSDKTDSFMFPVIVIGIYDLTEKKYHLIFTGKDFPVNMSIIQTEPKDIVKYPCKSEEELFSVFASIWLNIEPDIVVSFSTYDMIYLHNRMKMIGINPNFLSPTYNVWQHEDRLNIDCVDVIDYAELYRKVFGEPVWETLDFIANKELGYGKIQIGNMIEEWKKDYTKIVEYNLRDVELLKELEETLGLISDYLLVIWSLTGLKPSDCLRANNIGDILHLRHVEGKYIFRSTSGYPKKEYEGAMVLCENPGMYSNVVVLDWNELYPTIMDTFHMSIDTFDPLGDIKIEDDIGFISTKPGWTVEIMIPFRKRRQEVKQMAKIAIDKKAKRKLKIFSMAIKVIINSLYGLYGQKTEKFTSRFYDSRIAGAITFVGRDLLLCAKGIIEKSSNKLLYADTDSLFIQLKTKDPNEYETVRKQIELGIANYVKVKYNIESKFRLDFEYVFKQVIIGTKKKYDGITTSDERITKGFNIIRKDVASITIREQEAVGKMRFAGQPVEEIKKYIEKLCRSIALGKYGIEDIAVKGKCSQTVYDKVNRNVNAVQYSREKFGIDIKVGERFYWVYIRPTETIKVTSVGKVKDILANVIAFRNLEEFPKDVMIDYDKMADFTVRSPLKRYVEEKNIYKQTDISKYW